MEEPLMILLLEEEGKIKKSIFDLSLYGQEVRVINFTIYSKHNSHSKYLKNESAKVYWKDLLLINYPYHIRPGQTSLPGISWIADQNNLIHYQHLFNCKKYLFEYCYQPFDSLINSDNWFIQLMKDPWSFHQTSFQECFNDFIDCYNIFFDKKKSRPLTEAELRSQIEFAQYEESWRNTYHNKLHPQIEIFIWQGDKDFSPSFLHLL